jgi:hypothetical protein
LLVKLITFGYNVYMVAQVPHNKIPDEIKAQQLNDVFDLMSSGQVKSLGKACNRIGVNITTVMKWIDQDSTGTLHQQYTRARDQMHDVMADEILAIADSPAPLDASGRVDNGMVQLMRLQIDTRKWLLSKLAPKKYGDKLEISGSDSAPLRIERVERVIVGEARRVIESARDAEDAAYIDVCPEHESAPEQPALPAPGRKPRTVKALTVGEILERDAARRAARGQRPKRERKAKGA